MNYQETAEAYVRGQLPELTKVFGLDDVDIQLQHWLRVLEITDVKYRYLNTDLWHGLVVDSGVDLKFNLTTGQPATEEDYKALLEIVGV